MQTFAHQTTAEGHSLSEAATYWLDDSQSTKVTFEIERSTPGFQEVSVNDAIAAVRTAAEPAVEAAQTVLELVQAAKPAEAEVTFSLKVNGTANWVVGKASTEGNFKVRLLWKPTATEDTK